MMSNVIKKLDRAVGTIVGAAIGDALGMPTEFVSKRIFMSYFGGEVTTYQRAQADHPCGHLKAGQYTDDTQQLILLSESLVKNKGLYLEDFGAKIGIWGYRCKNEPGFDRFAGGTSLEAADKLYAGISPNLSGSTTTVSCGSAMRAAPVGIYYSDFEQTMKMAQLSSVPTHNSDIAREAAAIVAGIVNLLIHYDLTPIEAVEEVVRTVTQKKNADGLLKAIKMRQNSPEEAALEIGVGSSASETVSYAVYCFLHTQEDFEKTVITAANVDRGDSDTIACIAGAFSGAKNGFGAIPEKYHKIENFDYLKKLGEMLVIKT